MPRHLTLLALPLLLAASQPIESKTISFSFAESAPGTKVLVEEAYTPAKAYGFELLPKVQSVPTLSGKAMTGTAPALFSVKLPEGTYLLKLKLGGPTASVTTIKTESRQLQLENLSLAANETRDITLAVNIRTPKIPGDARGVHLKGAPARGYDESRNLRWDDKLTIEFNAPSGSAWAVQSLDITPAPQLPVVYLVGDSTVCDQDAEPYNSWGQMFPRWFGPTVAIANHAESGESYGSFVGEKRWDKILSTIKPGDFVLMQMGHNDEKVKQEDYAHHGYVDLMKKLVAEAKARGATPILMTPMQRYGWKDAEVTNSHGAFPEAVRTTAKAEGVTLIDLAAMSKTMYEALGPEGSVPLFAQQGGGKFDHTHHGDFGSYELSKCVASAIRSDVPALAKSLREESLFNPAKPDAVSSYTVPNTPNIGAPASRPAGN